MIFHECLEALLNVTGVVALLLVSTSQNGTSGGICRLIGYSPVQAQVQILALVCSAWKSSAYNALRSFFVPVDKGSPQTNRTH